MATGNIVIGSILGWIAFGICSALTGTVWAMLRRIGKLEKTVADLKRSLEERKGETI